MTNPTQTVHIELEWAEVPSDAKLRAIQAVNTGVHHGLEPAVLDDLVAVALHAAAPQPPAPALSDDDDWELTSEPAPTKCGMCGGPFPHVPASLLSDEERERLAGEYERLGAMASDPAFTSIWNHAADLARTLASQEQGEAEEGFEHCKRCGRGNTVWGAPSPLWNAVMRGGSINGDSIFGDLVCATCFMKLAEERGIASGFRVTAEQVNVELETVTPSGRVWDEDRQLWVDPPEHLERPEVPEEALAKMRFEEGRGNPDAVAWADLGEEGREHYRDQAKADLEELEPFLAPAIRKQERQRVREALLSDSTLDVATGAAYTQPIASNRREDMRAAFIAALDSLEDE